RTARPRIAGALRNFGEHVEPDTIPGGVEEAARIAIRRALGAPVERHPPPWLHDAEVGREDGRRRPARLVGLVYIALDHRMAEGIARQRAVWQHVPAAHDALRGCTAGVEQVDEALTDDVPGLGAGRLG